MTNALLDLMLKNGAVSFYDKFGRELAIETDPGSYVVMAAYGSCQPARAFKGDADGLLAFLQEVC